MKRTLFFIVYVLASLTMSAQEELPVVDIQNSGCLNETRGTDSQRVPTIVLTKEGSALSVQLLNYEENCCTDDFGVIANVSGGSDGAPVIYNLQGQRIGFLQKGLNIVNGRKVYIK